MKNIQTFEQALALAGTENEKQFFANTGAQEGFEPDELAYKKLKVVARALNTNPETGKVWQPDWHNTSQWKYYPWMEVEASAEQPAGFGFSFSRYGYVCSIASVGSRLCFPARDIALYAGKQFADLYKDFWLIPA